MHLLLNVVFFKVGWLSSVLGGANQMPWLGPVAVLGAIMLHLWIARRPINELLLILSCGVIGAVFDSALVAAGWVSYSSGMFSEWMAPYWIIAMWMLLGTTLNLSMRWLHGKFALAAVVGLVSGPMAYLAGAKLGGIVLVDQIAALATLGVGWMFILPGLTVLAGRFDGIAADSERSPATATS